MSAEGASAAAARLYGAGRYLDAFKAASAGLREHPEDARLWNVGAGAALALGLTADAEKFWQAALVRDPGYAGAYYNIGVLRYRARDFKAAAGCFARTLKLEPHNAAALNNLGAALKELGRLEESAAVLGNAVALDAANAEAWNNLAQALRALGRTAEARGCLDRAVALKPNFAEALSSRGRLRAEAGEQAEAIADFDAAIAARPEYGEAYQNRALVSRAERGAAWIGRLEAAYAGRSRLAPKAAIPLNFAMGKVREELGEYDAAFEAYAEGNRLQFAQQPFDASNDERWVAACVNAFRSELYPPGPPQAAARVPVFIVGMPRSGTTLIEQVLASHPEVHGAGELQVLGELVGPLRAEVPPASGRDTWLGELRALGREYCARVWSGAVTRPYVIDKMPGNYRYLGLLALMIPEARIISVRRDPLDTCLSCYVTPFESGHEYSSDLSALAGQYLRYERLMRHWSTVLPAGRLLEVQYEQVVADLEGQSRRMLDYLGLPWNEACLAFHRTARTVSTASVAQVRQPIYSRSIRRWEHFERHLGPLKALLDPAPGRAAVG